MDWGESRCVGLASFKTLQCLLNMVTIGDSERLSIVLLILSTKNADQVTAGPLPVTGKESLLDMD